MSQNVKVGENPVEKPSEGLDVPGESRAKKYASLMHSGLYNSANSFASSACLGVLSLAAYAASKGPEVFGGGLNPSSIQDLVVSSEKNPMLTVALLGALATASAFSAGLFHAGTTIMSKSLGSKYFGGSTDENSSISRGIKLGFQCGKNVLYSALTTGAWMGFVAFSRDTNQLNATDNIIAGTISAVGILTTGVLIAQSLFSTQSVDENTMELKEWLSKYRTNSKAADYPEGQRVKKDEGPIKKSTGPGTP